MRVLWSGPFASNSALKGNVAVNQAAAKWSRGLLRGLESAGAEIRVINHCSEQRWPAGRVFWKDNSPRWFLDWFPCERIAYCNAWGVKDTWLDRAYANAARRIFSTWHPDIVLCYNSLHSFNVVVMREAAKRGISAVPIILDGDDPRQDNWQKLLRDNRFAAGVVFLSWWMYQNYPQRNIPLFHMDGGAEEFKGVRPDESHSAPTPSIYTYTLVHTGALDRWRGLDFMKEIVRLCKRKDVRFVFCGKCDKEKMWAEFGNDSRIEVKGFISNEAVERICLNADLFMNVRNPDIGDNVVNYPSKVPNYLVWGKPVVSTWIDSFSPDYREVLCVPEQNTPEGFVRKIEEVLGWNEDVRYRHYEKLREWYSAKKQWNVQAERLIAFLKGLATKL